MDRGERMGKGKIQIAKRICVREAIGKKKVRNGGAMREMTMGIRKKLDKKKGIKMVKERLMKGRVKRGGEKWRIVGVYVSGGIEKTLERMGEQIEDKGEGIKTLIGEDFNARTEREGAGIERKEEERSGEGKSRKSKDKKINREGRNSILKFNNYVILLKLDNYVMLWCYR